MVEQTDTQQQQQNSEQQPGQAAAPAQQMNEENSLQIVVMDCCMFPTPPKKLVYSLPGSTTGEALFNKIAEETEYPKEHFEVKWNKTTIEPNEQRPLLEICTPLNIPNKITVYANKKQKSKDVEFKSKTPPITREYESTQSSSSSYNSSSSSSSSYTTSHTNTPMITYGPSLPSNSSNSSYTSYPSTGYTSSYNSYSWSQPAGKSPTGFCGLSNQGATCYMNSLIQTLFMTPEFRNGLYNWSFDEKIKNDIAKAQNGNKPAEHKEGAQNGDAKAGNGETTEKSENGNGTTFPGFSKEEREKKEKSSIPLQLQRLFARLQLCDVQAVKTKDLTKSFGWEDADAFTQHDVQELCRVLFDALEKNFQGTKQANLVNELYQGKMKDYVQCKECKHESARVDHYLDIPLVIRGFGETIPVKSVEEALHKFVTAEVLDKENQYNCEKCSKKVDAIKGLKIDKVPYLLTLQLKRFDFDLNTMRRIKLNDRVTFPLYLDMNPYVSGKRAPTQKAKKQQPRDEEDEDVEDGEKDEKGKGRADGETQVEEVDPMVVDSDDEPAAESQQAPQDIDHEPDFDAPPPKVTPELPYVYELFSVMIHRGSSMGGHYYAYVKSFETNKWYEFNDSMVSEISVTDIKKAFGGDEDGGYSSLPRSVYNSYRSNSNAYMLMYRQIEPTRNTKPMATTEIPEAIRKVVEDENGAAKQKKKAEELEREMIKLKIYYDGEDKPLSMHKTATLNDTAKAAVNLFGLGDKYTAGNYRLRNYSSYNELPTETFTGREEKSLDDLNFYTGAYSPKSLLLEVKEATEKFDEYDASQMLFRVAKFNPTTSGFDPVVNVYVSKHGTFGDLREAVEAKLGVPRDKQNLYKEPTYSSYGPPAQLIDKGNDVELRSAHMLEPEKIFVEYTERPIGYESSDDEEDGDGDTDERDDRQQQLQKMQKEREEREESPVIKALEKIRNTIEIKFNLPGKEEFDQKISVDKNMLVKDFREKIQPMVGLEIDDFKIKRGNAPHLYELMNESESLSDVNIRDGMTLTIEKGKPLREGEQTYTFEYFDLTKDSDNFTELFELPVHDDTLISDLKKALQPLLAEKNINVSDPQLLRLRDVSSSQYSRRIGKVFQDSLTVKKAMSYVYSKRVAIQVLSHPENVLNQEKDLCFFVQHFKPSTFELTKKEDFVISEEATLDELREQLGAKYGIEPSKVGILRIDNYYNFYDEPDLLEVPEMNWDRPTIAYSTKNTVGDTMMMRNGYLMLARDNTEKLKELTKEEKDAIKKETNKRKNAQNAGNTSSYSFWNRKERALKIQSEG